MHSFLISILRWNESMFNNTMLKTLFDADGSVTPMSRTKISFLLYLDKTTFVSDR